MEFFCYHRDRPGAAALRDGLPEEHCSYMDRHQARMIARGPTLADELSAMASAYLLTADPP